MLVSRGLLLFALRAACCIDQGKDSHTPTGTCEVNDGSPTEGCQKDNATTIHELGLGVIAGIFGRKPVSWQETRIATILASIDAAGYGEINRLHLKFNTTETAPGGQEHVDIIVKRFLPGPLSDVPPGSMLAVEHDRHMRAFHVEVSSYFNLSSHLSKAGLAAPRVIYATEANVGQPFTLLLEDLSLKFQRGANGQRRHMSRPEVSASIRWLAGFHALFWEDARAVERGLWPRGTYWLLDQLGMLEMQSVEEGFHNRYLSAHEWKRLHAAASAIDRRLSGENASAKSGEGQRDRRFQTLLHGDAKPENMLCSAVVHGESQCAALDFAWVGEGYGMYDIMYVVWGEYTQDIVDSYLTEYYSELVERLPSHAAKAYTAAIMRQHFDLCVVDFIRWWVGFRHGEHFWAMPWAMTIFRNVLWKLDGRSILTSFQYAAAIDHEFPLN